MKDKKSTKKENKSKFRNYIILGIIFIACVCLVLYLCKLYKVYDEYQKETPVIRGTLQEIVSDDLEHYLLDNPAAIFYVCTSNNDICREFEKDLKKFVTREELSDQIIYLNVTGLDQNKFVENFNNKYAKKKKLTVNYPAFILFEDGKAISILQGTENKKLTITKVEHFLELNNLGEE